MTVRIRHRASVKVVGMSAGGRMHVVAHASVGDPALLVPEPDNPHDPHAVAVFTAPRAALVDSMWTEHGWALGEQDRRLIVDRQVGYIPAALACRLNLPDRGIVGEVTEVRWGPTEYDTSGRPLDPLVSGIDVAAELALAPRPRPTPQETD